MKAYSVALRNKHAFSLSHPLNRKRTEQPPGLTTILLRADQAKSLHTTTGFSLHSPPRVAHTSPQPNAKQQTRSEPEYTNHARMDRQLNMTLQSPWGLSVKPILFFFFSFSFHVEEQVSVFFGIETILFTAMQRWRPRQSSILLSPEPYLYRVNRCAIMTFTLSETFTNTSTGVAFERGSTVFRVQDWRSRPTAAAAPASSTSTNL